MRLDVVDLRHLSLFLFFMLLAAIFVIDVLVQRPDNANRKDDQRDAQKGPVCHLIPPRSGVAEPRMAPPGTEVGVLRSSIREAMMSKSGAAMTGSFGRTVKRE